MLDPATGRGLLHDVVVEAGATATASFVVPEHEHQISGRVLDSDGAPVPSAFVYAIPEPSSGQVPGRCVFPENLADRPVDLTEAHLTVEVSASQGRTDLGDILIPTRRRIGPQPRGDWGFEVIRWNHDGDQLAQPAEVVAVHEGTEAQRLGLVVGDVITAMDEIDVTGNGRYILWFRMDVPVGARSVFELARGERLELRAE